MAKLQIPYNQAKKKFRMAEIPALQKELEQLRNTLNQTGNPDQKKAIKAQMDAILIKIKSFRQSDPVKDESTNIGEESGGAIATSTIGSPTIGDGEGGTKPAPFGSSAIFAKSTGTVSRKGYFPPVDKKKKKKKVREFIEFYNQD